MAKQFSSNDQLWTHSHIGPTFSVAYTGTAGTTGALVGAGNVVDGLFRVVVSSDAFVRQGPTSVVATASDMPLYIGQESYVVVHRSSVGVAVPAGDALASNAVSAIQQTAGGTLYVTNVSAIV